jgi:hypothetical protein
MKNVGLLVHIHHKNCPKIIQDMNHCIGLDVHATYAITMLDNKQLLVDIHHNLKNNYSMKKCSFFLKNHN